MDEEFKLPPGITFPSQEAVTERPRRRSIDTPNLRLDTSIVSAGGNLDVSNFPQPPRRRDTQPNVVRKDDHSSEDVAKKRMTAPAQLSPQFYDHSSPQTPVMRSIFPQYDHSVRLSQQHYYPASNGLLIPIPPPPPNPPSHYSYPQVPSLALIPEDDASDSKISDLPSRASQVKVSELSTFEQFDDLWKIAAGEKLDNASRTYSLAFKSNSLQHEHEFVSVGSVTNEMYSLQVSGSYATIIRKHPRSAFLNVEVVESCYSIPSATSPIFAALMPKLAEAKYIEEAKKVAPESPSEAEFAKEIISEATESLKNQNGGALLWDSDSNKHYLTLPFLLTNASTKEVGPLPIKYTREKSIMFLDTAGQLLLTLDLVKLTLKLEMAEILALTPSPHVVDVLVSAVLVFAVYMHRQEGLFKEPTMVAPYFPPPPKSASSGRRSGSQRLGSLRIGSTGHNDNSISITAPRVSGWSRLSRASSRPLSRVSEVPEFGDNRNSTLAFDKDIEAGQVVGRSSLQPHHIPPMTAPPISESGIAPELRGSNTGVDLSRFQAFDLEDPEMSGGTKIGLRIVYGLFSIIVWILGVVIGVVASLVVGAGNFFGGGETSREG